MFAVFVLPMCFLLSSLFSFCCQLVFCSGVYASRVFFDCFVCVVSVFFCSGVCFASVFLCVLVASVFSVHMFVVFMLSVC